MSNCFVCGAMFTGDVNELLAKYKKEFEEKGFERYFYHTGDKIIKIVRSESFKQIFKDEIKNNLKNGAEYAHIKEFTGI